MTSPGEASLDVVKRYLNAIERGASFDEIKQYLAPGIVQIEFPNQLMPNGATRRLPELEAAAASGRKVVTAQRYEIQTAVVMGEHVALEVRWIGTLAVPFGTIPAGGELTATFGVFFVVRDGQIQTQHNYDCFDPW